MVYHASISGHSSVSSVKAQYTLNTKQYFKSLPTCYCTAVYLWSWIKPQIRCTNRIATNTLSESQRQTHCPNRSDKYAARWFDTPGYQITWWFGTPGYQIIGGTKSQWQWDRSWDSRIQGGPEHRGWSQRSWWQRRVHTCTSKAREKYAEYKGTDCAKIRKHEAEHRNEHARRKFAEDFPNLKESTVPNFKKLYLEELKPSRDLVCHQPHCERKREISDFGWCGRQTHPCAWSNTAKRWCSQLSCCLHNSQGSPEGESSSGRTSVHFGHASQYWQRGFVLRAGTTSLPPVPMVVYQESRFDFLSEIKRKIDDYSIPRI